MNKNFEKQLWELANVIRGNADATEYRNIILTLVLIKGISDTHNSAWWNKIKNCNTNVKETLKCTINDIEAKYPQIKDTLSWIFNKSSINTETLQKTINTFSALEESQEDTFGRVYEYCLKKFAKQEGQNSGQFYTPVCIVKLLVEILNPHDGILYDPCMGSGGMFVQSTTKRGNNLKVYGQELNPTTWRLSKVNMFLKGINCDMGSGPADTLLNDIHTTLKADYIMANPPFNLSRWGAEKVLNDKRWVYGQPTDKNANFSWIQHMLYHLKDNGRIGLVLTNGSLSAKKNGEGKIRENLIKDGLVECIISLPSNLFYTTQIPVCLWVLSKKRKNTTLFIDATDRGKKNVNGDTELTDKAIKDIANNYHSYIRNEKIDDNCAIANINKIKEQGYILSPARYVDIPSIKSERINEKAINNEIKENTAILMELFNKSRYLEDKILEDFS